MWVRSGSGEQTSLGCGRVLAWLQCSATVAGETTERHTARPLVRSCNRSTCPVCVARWARREAAQAAPRLVSARELYAKHWEYLGNLKHVTFSPPRELWEHLDPETATADDYRQLRRSAVAIAKSAGVSGGCVVFHPWGGGHGHPWVWRPHFHILGYGHLEHAGQFHARTGWVYRNHGYRKTVEGTVSYELGHCGVCDGVHTLTWFGCLSYNRLRTVCLSCKRSVHRCAVCGAPVHRYPLLSDGTVSWLDGVPYHVYERKIIYELTGG